MDVFKISGFVEDKNLAKVKRLVAGFVYEFRDEPVVNAQAKNGAVRATHQDGAVGAILYGLKPGVQITSTEITAKLVEAGYSKYTYGKLLNKLTEAKVLRRVSRGIYELTAQKMPPTKARK